MKRLYIYLASRSRRDIRLVTVLQGNAPAAKLTDLGALALPPDWEARIKQIIHENRMDYEPWAESARDFKELLGRLAARGFTHLPMGANPLLDMAGYNKAPEARTKSLVGRKTMTRKQPG